MVIIVTSEVMCHAKFLCYSQHLHGLMQLCWEQARNLLLLEPQFKANGFRLVAVSIGNPEGAATFCKEVPFPPELLYLDPDRK